MPTAILRPESGGTHTWSLGTNPDDVNDEVEDPTAGDGLFVGATYVNGDDNDVEVFVFPTIADISEVTNITVKTYVSANEPSAQGPEIEIYMGSASGYTFWGMNSVPYVWWTKSYGGSWSQSDLDGLLVRYRANTPYIEKGLSANNLDVVYVIVTYTPVLYIAGKPLGVEPANIGSVMGVARANIASIKGV